MSYQMATARVKRFSKLCSRSKIGLWFPGQQMKRWLLSKGMLFSRFLRALKSSILTAGQRRLPKGTVDHGCRRTHFVRTN